MCRADTNTDCRRGEGLCAVQLTKHRGCSKFRIVQLRWLARIRSVDRFPFLGYDVLPIVLSILRDFIILTLYERSLLEIYTFISLNNRDLSFTGAPVRWTVSLEVCNRSIESEINNFPIEFTCFFIVLPLESCDVRIRSNVIIGPFHDCSIRLLSNAVDLLTHKVEHNNGRPFVNLIGLESRIHSASYL